ncbi:hypothetical protein LTR27_002940 [Elasticomyces elasticus]|nr:hypothetical protein LTR27_002940 [Elasticomyces elasticus]
MVATTRGASSASRPSIVPVPLVLVPTPTTPSRSGRSTINEFLHNFCGHFDVELPVHETVSPDKREQTLAHNVLKKITPLFYRQKDALDHAFNDLKAMRPSVRDQPNRLQILDRRLGEAVSTSIVTPHSRRSPSPTKAYDATEDRPPPLSPTLAVKHAPPQQHHFTHPAALPKSAGTSFATTMNDSFISDGTSATRASLSTAATSMSASQTAGLWGSPWAPEDQERLHGEISKLEQLAAAPAPPDRPAAQAAAAEHHRVRDIPIDGLVSKSLDVPESLASLPFYLVAEAYRVMRFYKIPPQELEKQWTAKKKTLDSLHKISEKYALAKGPRFQKGIETNYDGHTLSARLRRPDPDKTSGPLFNLELHAPRKEDTNAFQRKAGGDRILIVDLPVLDCNLSITLKGQEPHLQKRRDQLLGQNQNFLGRTWVAFYARPRKGPDADPEDASNCQVTFVALEGRGIPRIDIRDFTNHHISLCENLRQTACKAGSRLDLAGSRARRLHVFKTHEIIRIPDIMSNDVPEEDRFNDPAIPVQDWSRKPVGMGTVEMTRRTPIKEEWGVITHSYHNSKDSKENKDKLKWDEAAIGCRQRLVDIMPVNRSDPTVIQWLHTVGKAPATVWEDIRASTLYKKQRLDSKGSLPFTIAGAELCRLKMMARSGIVAIRPDIHSRMKPQKRSDWVEDVSTDADADEATWGSDDDELFDEGASIFDRSEYQADLGAAESAAVSNRKRRMSPAPDAVVKRQQPESSSPSSSRNKQLPPTPQDATADAEFFEADDDSWLQPSYGSTASQKRTFIKRRD